MSDVWELKAHLEEYREHLVSISEENNLAKAYERIGNYYKKIDHLRPKYNTKGEVDYTLGDLVYMAEDTRISVASLIYYFGLGLSPVKIPFDRTFIDRLFFYFVDDSYSRLYSCWNRVGNFLNLFFQKVSDKIYFVKVMKALEKDKALGLDSDKNFSSLVSYWKGDYKKIDQPRHQVIHNFMSYWKYFENYLEKHSDPKELEQMGKEREEIPAFFIQAYQRLIQGIDEAIEVIAKNAQ